MSTKRVQKLRKQSLEAPAVFSAERARLITDFYAQNPENYSVPMQRALSFSYLIENRTICINDGELIVGEKGEFPKATPAFPELCCHSLADLDLLDSREKIPFKVAPQVRNLYEEKTHSLLARQVHAGTFICFHAT